jgi:DNA-binding CsgD family transcriptional regulator
MNTVQSVKGVESVQETGGQQGLLLGVLHAIDYGVIVVDAAQTILIANHSAQATLKSERFLVERGKRLEPRQASQHTAFTQALQHAFTGKRRMFAMHDGDHAITCAMVPILPAEYQTQPTVLVMVSRPQVCQPLSVSLFAKDEGLSATETAVLNGLCNGLDPAEIAQNHGVAINTIRTQILSIRAKTQSPSIRALVQRLALLPPVLPALQ